MINQTENMRIVVIEDEGAIRKGLVNMINGRTRHQVVGICKNGIEGIAAIEKEKPDCVITDIRMEEMDGLEMLKILHDKKIMPYSIILSGYSDFEYARKALRLGVEEYLLKPISIDMLETSLQKIEEKLEKSRNEQGYQFENDIRACLFGEKEEAESAEESVKQILGDSDCGILLTGYYGNIEENVDILDRQIKTFIRLSPDLRIVDVAEKKQKLKVLILIGKNTEYEAAISRFKENVVEHAALSKYEIHWASSERCVLSLWKSSFEKEKQMLLDALAVTGSRLFEAGHADNEQKEILEYPHGIEKKILRALGDGNKEETKKYIDEFLDTVVSLSYDAKDIRRVILKLMSQMIDTAKEINQKAYDILRTQNGMQDVLNAYTKKEVGDILTATGDVICEKDKKEGISNYIVNRTLEYIRIHYKEGITLEETAEILNITPEYLSMLFKGEMGMNFSVFLKKFRISHAKRLLRGTDMKVYEVAEACGYSNSNYFTRVFKEETGISPAEFH